MSIFDENVETPTKEQPTEKQEANFLEELVSKKGERFRDPNEIAKKALHADEYIEKLKEENVRLKAYEDFIEGLKKDPKAGLAQLSKPEETPEPKPKPKENTTPEEGDIESRLEALLSKKEQEKRVKDNLTKAEDVLYQTYGDKAKEVVASKAEELGLSVKKLAEMASESPAAFLRLVGAKDSDQKQVRQYIPSTMNTEGTARRPTGAAYYQDQLDKNPKLAYDPKFMMKWAEQLQKEKQR